MPWAHNELFFGQNWNFREFPGSPVVRTWHFHCQGLGLIPGQGTKILQAEWHGQKKKKEFHRDRKGHILPSVRL